jgi:hypothetical protein
MLEFVDRKQSNVGYGLLCEMAFNCVEELIYGASACTTFIWSWCFRRIAFGFNAGRDAGSLDIPTTSDATGEGRWSTFLNVGAMHGIARNTAQLCHQRQLHDAGRDAGSVGISTASSALGEGSCPGGRWR